MLCASFHGFRNLCAIILLANGLHYSFQGVGSGGKALMNGNCGLSASSSWKLDLKRCSHSIHCLPVWKSLFYKGITTRNVWCESKQSTLDTVCTSVQLCLWDAHAMEWSMKIVNLCVQIYVSISCVCRFVMPIRHRGICAYVVCANLSPWNNKNLVLSTSHKRILSKSSFSYKRAMQWSTDPINAGII